jgi:hypothetical protein
MKKSIVLILVFVQAMMLSIASSATALTWTPAALIETGAGSASSPRIAVDPSGNVMAVWVQSDGTSSSIYANRYVVGSGWGTATLLEISDMPADSPRIAADSNGNFIAVWRQAWKTVNGALYGIHANRYVAGAGWGDAATVYVDTSRGDVTANGDPQIGVDPNGNAVVVWSVYDWSWNHTSVRANRYAVGTGWGGVTNLSTEAVRAAYSPTVALDSTGNAIVVWSQDSGTSSVQGIKAARYGVETGWGTPVPIEPTTIAETRTGSAPQIAFDLNGNAIAVWYQYGKPGIYTNRYVAGTGWGIAEAIVDVGTTSYDEGVQLAIDKNGNAIAVWNQYGGVLYANRYIAGTGWSATVIVDPGGGQDYSAQIAVDPNGNAIAVWGNFSCNSYNIMANLEVFGTGWGAVSPCWAETPSFVNTARDYASEPQIVIDQNRNVTVVWTQYGNIYASMSATPPPLVANAGSNQVAFDKATLNGSASQSNIISWNWTLTHRTNPAYSRTATGQNPSVDNLAAGFYDVLLTASDGTTTSTATSLLAVAGPWDVNNDGKVGLAEAIYILQKMVGIR